MRHLKVGLDESYDPALLGRIEDVLHGENLIQVILHAHLLIERALVIRISEKLARPEIMTNGKYAKLSFAQKTSLYIGMYGPSEEDENLLLAFNKLRNMIAHQITDEEECVRKCLPWDGWDGEKITSPPEPLRRVHVCAMILLFTLGAIKSVHRTDMGSPPSVA